MVTNEFPTRVTTAFGFLSSRFGFNLEVVSPTEVNLRGPRVVFRFRCSDRDGLDVNSTILTFGEVAEPDPLSLATFVGTIHTAKGLYTANEGQSLEVLAQGLSRYGQGLILGDETLYRKAAELRFWHVGSWRKAWGQAIMLTPTEIHYQESLVSQLLILVEGNHA